MRNAKKMLALMLSVVLAAGTVQMPAFANTSANEAEKATVSLYPAAQSMKLHSEEGMKLQGTVDLVVHGEQDVATLPKLKEILTEEGYTFEEKTAVGSNAAVVLAVDCGKQECPICKMPEDAAGALLEEQGYVLDASDDVNENGQVTIVGADADGTYYGVMTFLQMLKQKTTDGRIAEVTVSDYPDIKFRGYVEGFYGFPWSFNDRKELFEDTTMYKMNTYIYAPKDDPYHRDSWRTLYPETEGNNLKALAEVAAANNMEFCWTIHPGADYSYSGTTDYNKLIAKLEQVYSFGIRQFGIFYDDLSYSVANGTRHAEVINNAYAYLQDKYGDVKPFITVLTRYTNSWGADMYSYFRPFMQNINEDTIILWTGNGTMSAITYDYFQWPKDQTGIDRDFGVWWNYPVNDYCDGHLLMSPLHCVDNDVTNICSFFLNPMSEADASKVAIYSGADYSWNMEAFDSQSSWERAIFELVPEANEAFERFADNIGYVNEGSGFIFEESVYLEEELSSFETAVRTGEGVEAQVQNMKARFEQIISDADQLKTIKDAELLEEITVHVDAYKVLGQAGVAAMEAYGAAAEGDIEACFEKIGEAEALLEDSKEFTVPVFEGGRTIQVRAFVGNHTLVPFLEEALDGVMSVLSASLTTERSAKMLTNVEGVNEQDIRVDGSVYSVENITAAMKEGDYVGIALPKAMLLSDINAEVTPAENFRLQYSLNGIEWNDVTKDEVMTGAYVRALCTADNTAVNLTKLSVTQSASAANAKNPSVSTNMLTYQTYRISNALDGNMDTKYYSSEAANAGDYVQVDLKESMAIDNAAIYFGGSPNDDATAVDGFNSTKLQISENGSDWTDVGGTLSYTQYSHIGGGRYVAAFATGGVNARYVRFTAVTSGDNWVQVYEIEFNDFSLVEGTVSIGQGSYLDDGDISSAPVISNVKDGDTLIYPMTTVTEVGTIGIYQSADAISNAAVSVQTTDGNWKEIGTLDKVWNVLEVGETILNVKLTFDGSVTPVLYEIVVKEAGDESLPTPEVTETPSVTEEPQPTVTEEPQLTVTEEPQPTVTEEPQPSVTEAPNPTETPETETSVTEIFTDVYKDWYTEYVQYVYDNGLMTGIKGTTQFAPNANITKAQVAQVLYNMEAQPAVKDPKVFTELTDVYSAEWYANAVAWAYETGVVTGDTNAKKFFPNADVTREQLALMMYRYAAYKQYDVSVSGDLSGLQNAENTANWALDGVKWAVGKGLISGVEKNGVKDLAPQGNASRAQVAAILQRFCENVK